MGGDAAYEQLRQQDESRVAPGGDEILQLLKKGPNLILLDEGGSPKLGIRLCEVVEGFFSFLGFTHITSQAVIRKSVARGVREGVFGYVSGAVPELIPERKFQVAMDKVRCNVPVGDDEIDLDTGFIMLPKAIPAPAPIVVPTTPTPDGTPTGEQPQPPITLPGQPQPIPGITPPVMPLVDSQKLVEITFFADRNALFTAWNAAANLADLAGQITVNIRAGSAEGFDKNKLQNGVLEPLREADLIE